MTLRKCATCKHFFANGFQGHPECRLYPPRTTQFIVGMARPGQPVFHNSISYNLVTADMNCGQWAQSLKIE